MEKKRRGGHRRGRGGQRPVLGNKDGVRERRGERERERWEVSKAHLLKENVANAHRRCF